MKGIRNGTGGTNVIMTLLSLENTGQWATVSWAGFTKGLVADVH